MHLYLKGDSIEKILYQKEKWYKSALWKGKEKMGFHNGPLIIGISIRGLHKKAIHILSYEIVERILDENICGYQVESVYINTEQQVEQVSQLGIIIERKEKL